MATISSNMVSIGGIPIHYARCGKGEPLLLLHGWPEFWLTWEPVMQRLADKGLNTVIGWVCYLFARRRYNLTGASLFRFEMPRAEETVAEPSTG